MAISVECECGKTLKIDEKHRGKKAKCPACGSVVLVEEKETAVQAEKPKKRAAPDRDDDDGEDSEIRKPIKKKAKSSMMTWLLAGGCGAFALLTCCMGIGGG